MKLFNREVKMTKVESEATETTEGEGTSDPAKKGKKKKVAVIAGLTTLLIGGGLALALKGKRNSDDDFDEDYEDDFDDEEEEEGEDE